MDTLALKFRPVYRRGACLTLLAAGLLCLPVSAALASVDLKPLITAPGSVVELDPKSVYSAEEIWLYTDKTIFCNGATIQSTGGPLRASAPDMTLTVDNCNFQGTGWALLAAASESKLIVRNATSLTGNGNNSCIYVGGSSLELSESSIDQCHWGVNMENANAAIHATSIKNATFGIQNVAGHVLLDGNSHLENSDYINPGVGLSVIASANYPSTAASATIRNSSFTGFGNAVDIQPTAALGLPPGTVEITDSTFKLQAWSALAAVDAVDVVFKSNRVIDVLMDGIFLVNTTGVIEDSEIIDSLNTGVTFWGCPDGATLRNSLVSGSIHQGVAIVGDYDNDRDSRNIQIIGNTLKDNVIANILVDERSDAVIQGNILQGSPGANVRLHGSRSAQLIGNFFHKAEAGLEMTDAAYANGALSIFTHHDNYGALLYGDAMASFSHSVFYDNGVLTGNYSLFSNDGAQISVQQSLLGPAGAPGLYSNAGNEVLADNNYWGHATGPELPYNNGGSGAMIGWNVNNNSSISYMPFLTSTPLESRINEAINLRAKTSSAWSPDIGLTVRLTGSADAPKISDGLMAALRLTDTSSLEQPLPPSGTFADGVISTWVEYDLLTHTRSGSLRIKTGADGESAQLSRLKTDQCWEPVDTNWNAGAGEVVFSPSDPELLAGIFALGEALPSQDSLARQLITAYYWDILNRPPEPGAVDSWFNGYFNNSISIGIDVRFVFREMARVFFSSKEYQARERSNEQFILDNYQVFLSRQPSQTEFNGWQDGNWNRAQVVSLFAESAEFGAYIQGLFTCHGGVPTRNFVTTMYIGLLDRLVDGNGLAYFEGIFDLAFAAQGINGVREAARDLGAQIIASNEYQLAGPTSETHVVRLYRAYLGRFPSLDELAYWQNQLDTRKFTITSLIEIFSNSGEFTSRLNTFFGPY